MYYTTIAIPPRRCTPISGTLRARNLPTGRGTADSDDDVTGDSGLGTGLGNAQYEDVVTWRRAFDAPTPGKTAIPKCELHI